MAVSISWFVFISEIECGLKTFNPIHFINQTNIESTGISLAKLTVIIKFIPDSFNLQKSKLLLKVFIYEIELKLPELNSVVTIFIR